MKAHEAALEAMQKAMEELSGEINAMLSEVAKGHADDNEVCSRQYQ